MPMLKPQGSAGWTSGDRRMTIDSNGNVGMGTTNPQGKLHILSDSTTDPYVFVTSHTTAGYGVVVSTTGNVGIGTTAPGATLQVDGTMKVLGAWETKSTDTVYQALTDGFVMVLAVGDLLGF